MSTRLSAIGHRLSLLPLCQFQTRPPLPQIQDAFPRKKFASRRRVPDRHDEVAQVAIRSAAAQIDCRAVCVDAMRERALRV